MQDRQLNVGLSAQRRASAQVCPVQDAVCSKQGPGRVLKAGPHLLNVSAQCRGSVPSAKQEASLNGKGDALDEDIEQMNKQLQQQVANFETTCTATRRGRTATGTPWRRPCGTTKIVHAVGRGSPKGNCRVPAYFSDKGPRSRVPN